MQYLSIAPGEPEEVELEPVTEPRPELTEAWASLMMAVPEIERKPRMIAEETRP